jgi:hypothetical protein
VVQRHCRLKIVSLSSIRASVSFVGVQPLRRFRPRSRYPVVGICSFGVVVVASLNRPYPSPGLQILQEYETGETPARDLQQSVRLRLQHSSRILRQILLVKFDLVVR